MQESLVLLYDGLCGFCNGWVTFILEHDKSQTMRFTPLQGAYAADLMRRHPSIAEVDSIVLVSVRNGLEHIRFRSDAAIAIGSYLGGFWKLSVALRIIPRPVRDYVYDVIARHRYRFFVRYDACPLPNPDQRHRFLQ